MSSRSARRPSPERTSVTTTSTSASRPPKLWYQHLTLDLFVYVLGRSIFHPAIVYIFYLCIAAMHRHRTPVAHYTLYWAFTLLVVAALRWLNHRFSYGTSRPLDWDNEVVVVTGGARGLGRVLAEMYAMRGVSTAILDVRDADAEAVDLIDGGNGSLHWFACDVGDRDGVDVVMEVIAQKIGRPTILINNAAAGIVGRALCGTGDGGEERLSSEAAAKSVGVNLLAHFYTLANLLQGVGESAEGLSRGMTVVTVSSILAHLSPARLSDYVAAKAAVSSLHHTLTNEIRLNKELSSSIKTILVETGQMDTEMFAGVRTPWYAAFLGPVLEAKDVARVIVNTIDRGQGGIIRMPFYATLVPLYHVMPGSLQLMLRRLSGIDAALP